INGDLLSPELLPDTFLDLVLSRHPGKSIFRLESGQVFAKQALPELFVHGRLQVFGAVRDSKLIAMDLCMVGSNSLCTWNGGFLEEAAFFSPGTVLTAFGIRAAIETGCKDYDFLRGNEEYKTRWATGSHVVGEITLSRS
ncbi:MAG: GNAT family N-acetyltransferase, partial [Blastocatellia bacterium]